MACIHYRFPFQADYKFIPLNGLQITVRDMKAQIMKQEHLKSSNCDLKISNDQDEEYTDETTPLEKYSCVIVRRIPVRVPVHKSHPSASSSLLQSTETANLVEVKASEEDRIRAEILPSSHCYQITDESQKYLGPSPPHYVCHRCGQPGHYIQKCPMRLNALKKVRTRNVIPQSFLVKAEAGDDGAMLTSTGGYVKSAADKEGYKHDKKEHPPFLPRMQPELKVVSNFPEELVCVLCKLLMVNAAIVPCCGYSFCDNCIRTILLESEQHICVTCQQTVSPDSIVPNLALQQAIRKFESNTEYTKCWRKGRNRQMTKVQLTRCSAPYSSHRSHSRPPSVV